MHSSTSYLMLLALLVILSISIGVQASPIPVSELTSLTTYERRNDAETGPIFEAMDVSKREAFESADDASFTFFVKRAMDADIEELNKREDDSPTQCPKVCPTIYKPVCGINSKGVKRTFPNQCELNVWNCLHPMSKYIKVSDGECD